MISKIIKRMNPAARLSLDRLLWIDGFAALIAGVLLLFFRHFGAELFRLPVWLLTLQACINFCYAAYSLPLACRRFKPEWMVRLLIAGNLLYPLVAAGLLAYFFSSCSAFGVAFFLAEIMFIGGLGVLEWQALERKPES